MQFERREWGDDAQAAFVSPEGVHCIPILAAEVRSGRAKLFRATDRADLAWIITRFEPANRELCVCYIEGSGIVKFCRELRDVALAQGYSIRAHTTQPGIARLMRRLGAVQAEIVLRIRP